MCRRHKKDVMPQLPERTYQEYEVTLHHEQQQVSDRLIEMAKDTPDDKQVLSYLMMARLAANSMLQIKNSESPIAKSIPIEDTTNSKITVLKEILETINEKVIIFSQWKTSAKEVFDALIPLNQSILITGDTDNKQEMLTMFRNSPDIKYLIATDCLNYGLNIPEAHIMIMFDTSFSPSVNEQRVGRMDRLTQKCPMLIITLTAKDSIESRVKEILEHKKKMFDTVIDGGANVTEASLVNDLITQLRKEARQML
jgi:SNF2 family DNA or RNA helicase